MIHLFQQPSLFFHGILCLLLSVVPLVQASEPAAKKIVFLGDSITAGYGLKKEQAYPALIKELAQEDGHAIQVVNAGLSGDTTSGGLRRIRVLARKPMDLLVIALGGNDGLRGIPPKTSQANLEAIVDYVQQKHPKAKIIIAGMQMPDNMGKDYTDAFQKMFSSVADRKKVHHLKFLLENVAAEKSLNLADGIHPNAQGQAIIAKHVYKAMVPLLK